MASLLRYRIHFADSPFWAFAIHDGHQIDPTIVPFVRLDDGERAREEDAHTSFMAELPGVNQVFVSTSRFQLDLNRTEKDAVYLRPEQAWGLNVWKDPLPASILHQLHQDHRNFYQQIDQQIRQTIDTHGFFIVFDIHSYNAQRIDEKQSVDKEENPQINLGTDYNHQKWRPVIDAFIDTVRERQLLGQPIDIRENIKFKGGYLAQHIIQKFGGHGCVLSIEFRKDFMNEWTGLPYPPIVLEYKQLLLHTLKNLQKQDIYGV